ncbi:MAG: AAA family ATPase [Selenomonadaceae bacterium]|nr:AAA family ATPase [Selenomonadaceae bacterium]
MVLYINSGSELFEEARRGNIYVDKSGIINYINSVIRTNNKYICVSRPRRFGKTMGINMLLAYYGVNNNADNLFKDLKAETNNKYANSFFTVKINGVTIFEEAESTKEAINDLRAEIINELKCEFENIDFSECKKFSSYFSKVYNETKRQFIVLVDEWDGIFREMQNDEEGHKAYLTFLRNWLKDKEYIALAYMTGILPIKKYGQHSALNMFKEFSMENPGVLAEYVGFTRDEVKNLCKQYDMDYDLCGQWYNGYHFANDIDIYSPLSVSSSMTDHSFASYWNKTESYEALQKYIQMNFDGLKDVIIRLMAGDMYKVNTRKFANDMVSFKSIDDILTLLVHLGYLGYDLTTECVYIPNKEVRMEYYSSIEDDMSMGIVVNAIKNSDNLLKATWELNSAAVAEGIEAAHFETSHLQYNDENVLSYVISLAYYTAREKYTIHREFPTGKGFADLTFIPRGNYPNIPAMVIELKFDNTAETAINQIKNKTYTKKLEDYTGNIIIAGINYNKKSKKHECIIEKCTK